MMLITSSSGKSQSSSTLESQFQFWQSLPAEWLSANDVVARMHTIELMEEEFSVPK